MGPSGVPEPPGAQPGRPDLAELLEKVARGGQDAFEEVYTQLSGPVYGLALRVVRDAAQAEEVAQEVLVEPWRKAARYQRSQGSATAWVMTMAHRRDDLIRLRDCLGVQ